MRKNLKLSITLAAASALCAGQAYAQSPNGGYLLQPRSVAQVDYGNDYSDYYADYYADDAEQKAAEAPSAADNNGGTAACDTCDDCGQSCGGSCGGRSCGGFFDPSRPGLFTVSGWVNGGATLNDHSVGNNPQQFINNGGQGSNFPVGFNDREQGQLNQLYLIIGRELDTSSRGWDIGGQIDLLYGSDARFTQALGLDDNIISDKESLEYKMAIPQLYGSLGVGDFTLIVGHFYTFHGYEVVPAPGNFFYSHAYTMQYGEPFTHTGALLNYQMTDNILIYNGLVRGWDNWNDNNGNWTYLGGISMQLGEDTSILATIISGNEDDAGANNRTLYTIVVQQAFGPFRYVVQHDNGWENNASAVQMGEDAEWYGLNQYLFFDYNELLALGARFEWFRDDDGARVGFGDTNYYQCTLGANVKPTGNAIIRPEVRWDWQDGGAASTNAYAQGTQRSQFTAAFDFIVTY